MEKLKIGVIGLGLIGGSILKRLHSEGFKLLAVSKSSCTKAEPYCIKCSDTPDILKEADVVFVCCEMSKTISVLDELNSILKGDTLVTDVCSLKEFVCKGANERPYRFIGSHPMAGTEFCGFENSFPSLFEGAKWVLTEHNETLEYLIKKMGAKPVITESKDHDSAVAKISHLPMLLAQAIFHCGYSDELARTLASSGFRDMTRLAMTNETLACDMISLNRENILKAFREIEEYLTEVNGPSSNRCKELFGENLKNRAKMYDNNGKNTL